MSSAKAPLAAPAPARPFESPLHSSQGDSERKLDAAAAQSLALPGKERLECWEILVPTVSNAGKPYRTRFHRVWDERVRKISGGLTILSPAKGQWVDPKEGTLYVERMIPVRIIATHDQIAQIARFTAEYYQQIEVCLYRISDTVVFFRP